MKNKDKPRDPLPETFATVEESGEFWDTHSTSDYEEYLEPEDDVRFLLAASESSLRKMWRNVEDDSYVELLEE